MANDELKKSAENALDHIPETHKRRGLAASIGAFVGGAAGSILGGPVGAMVGGPLGSTLGVALGEQLTNGEGK